MRKLLLGLAASAIAVGSSSAIGSPSAVRRKGLMSGRTGYDPVAGSQLLAERFREDKRLLRLLRRNRPRFHVYVVKAFDRETWDLSSPEAVASFKKALGR